MGPKTLFYLFKPLNYGTLLWIPYRSPFKKLFEGTPILFRPLYDGDPQSSGALSVLPPTSPRAPAPSPLRPREAPAL